MARTTSEYSTYRSLHYDRACRRFPSGSCRRHFERRFCTRVAGLSLSPPDVYSPHSLLRTTMGVSESRTLGYVPYHPWPFPFCHTSLPSPHLASPHFWSIPCSSLLLRYFFSGIPLHLSYITLPHSTHRVDVAQLYWCDLRRCQNAEPAARIG